MNRGPYYIYSLYSDQSVVISRLLRQYFKSSLVYGVASHNERGLKLGPQYSDKLIEGEYSAELFNDGVVIPTGAMSTEQMLRKSDVTIGKITLSRDMVKVFDKSWTLTQASLAGLAVPFTFLDIDEATAYPLFYKQRHEKGGGTRGIALSKKDIPLAGREDLIFQEYIDSPGTYGVSFLACKGELLTLCSHFESVSFPKEGGSAVVIEAFEDEKLVDCTTRLLKQIEYSGWGLAEFKYCRERQDYVLMEINAKFWASCEFAFANEPLFLELLFGIKSQEACVSKILFLDRAMARGLFFTLNQLFSLYRSARLRSYTKLSKLIVSTFIPRRLLRSLKASIRKTLLGNYLIARNSF